MALETKVSSSGLIATIIELKVSREITGQDLYDLAGSSFAPGTVFKLLLQDKLLQRDSDPALKCAPSPVVLNFTTGWHRQGSEADGLFLDGGGLCNLVRRGRHKLAHAVLLNSTAALREELTADVELLSWVAYTSGGARQGSRPDGRPVPGALRLLWEMILRQPQQVCRRDPQTGKLPLHDAAWGMAPFQAAVMLAAVAPASVQDRRNRGCESPHDVGRYVHPGFSWPSPEQLMARASRLRSAGQLMGRLRSLLPQRQVGLQGCIDGGLKLGLRASFLIASCLTDCQELIHNGLIPATVLTLTSSQVPMMQPVPKMHPEAAPSVSGQEPPTFPSQRRVRERRRRPVGPKEKAAPSVSGQEPPPVPSQRRRRAPELSDSAVNHLRENFVRDGGVYGGAHRVRNRRCSFVEVSEILVGEKRFKLETHVSHTVHSSIQRSAPEKAWPCKSVWQKERRRERHERWSTLMT